MYVLHCLGFFHDFFFFLIHLIKHFFKLFFLVPLGDLNNAMCYTNILGSNISAWLCVSHCGPHKIRKKELGGGGAFLHNIFILLATSPVTEADISAQLQGKSSHQDSLQGGSVAAPAVTEAGTLKTH